MRIGLVQRLETGLSFKRQKGYSGKPLWAGTTWPSPTLVPGLPMAAPGDNISPKKVSHPVDVG
jgi:hypothetical protein